MKKELDVDRFSFAMARLKVALPVTSRLTEDEEALRMEVFWKALEAYEISQVERAIDKATQKLEFFPSPSQIIDFIRSDSQWPEFKQMEYKEVPVSSERAREMLREIWQRMDAQEKAENDRLGKEFEEKRKLTKQRAARFMEMIERNKIEA